MKNSNRSMQSLGAGPLPDLPSLVGPGVSRSLFLPYPLPRTGPTDNTTGDSRSSSIRWFQSPYTGPQEEGVEDLGQPPILSKIRSPFSAETDTFYCLEALSFVQQIVETVGLDFISPLSMKK